MELSEQPLAVKNVVQFRLYVALSSMNIGLSANAWLLKWETTREASPLSRYFWPVRLPSRTYKSNLVKGKTTPDTARGCSDNSMACDVARHEPYRVCMGLFGRKINQHNPKCQNIDELRTAILQEWQQFPQEWLRCLVQSMTRRVTELHYLQWYFPYFIF
jgi:hypothetical protein